MDKAEAIERLEYLKAKAQLALEQEVPEWIAEDLLGTIEAYDMAIEALQTEPQTDVDLYPCDTCVHDCDDWNCEACDPCSKANSNYEPKPNNCETCKHYDAEVESIACERCLDGKYSRYEPKDEPQYHADIECNYKDCENCEHQSYCPQREDEPKYDLIRQADEMIKFDKELLQMSEEQTDCPWK